MTRPPRSGVQRQWIGTRPTPGVVALLVVEVGVFLVWALVGAPEWVARHLALRPRMGLGSEPWQLITTGLVHLRFSTILFNAFAIWIFGTAIEERVGRSRMLTIFIAAQLAAALGAASVGRWLAPDMVLDGCAGGAAGLIGGFGAVYVRTPLSLFGAAEMRGRTVALVMLGFSGGIQLIQGDVLGLTTTVVGGLGGWVAASGVGDRVAFWRDRLRMWRLRRRYKVLPGGRDHQRRYLN